MLTKINFVRAVTREKTFSGEKRGFLILPVGSVGASACGRSVRRTPALPFLKPLIFCKLIFQINRTQGNTAQRPLNSAPAALSLCGIALTTKRDLNSNEFRSLDRAPEGTRTPDLLVRSQSLYPAELPAHSTSLFRLP